MSRLLSFIALASIALAGCAPLGGPTALPDDSNTPTAIEADQEAGAPSSLDALLEAPDRQQTTCTSVTPISSQTPLNTIEFACEQLGVTATLPQIRDAGWRMESMEVGQQETQADGLITMPLRITIRKLF